MAKAKAVEMPERHMPSFSFTKNQLKGIEKLSIDDKVSLRIECEVKGISRDEYAKGEPLQARFSITSAKVLDFEEIKKIKDSKTIKELEEAAKD